MYKKLTPLLICLLSGSALFAQSIPDVPTLFPIQRDGKWGFINDKGRPVISPRYEDVGSGGEFYEGLIPVKLNGRWGYMNEKGKIVISCNYLDAGGFSSGLADVKVNENTATASEDPMHAANPGKLGYINKKGEMVFQPQSETRLLAENSFSEGMCLYYKNNKFGFINAKGKMAIPEQYKWAYSFHNGLAAVQNENGKFGYVDKKGKWAQEAKYFHALSFYGAAAPVAVGSKFGFIDKKGKLLTDTIYSINHFFGAWSEGMWEVSVDGRFGFVNDAGKVIVAPQYAGVHRFTEGLAAVSMNGVIEKGAVLNKVTGGWGFIDKLGKLVINYQFDEVGVFREGMAAAKKDGKWGFINKKGEWVIKPKFDSAPCAFHGGLARIDVKDTNTTSDTRPRIGYVNIEGNFVWDPQR